MFIENPFKYVNQRKDDEDSSDGECQQTSHCDKASAVLAKALKSFQAQTSKEGSPKEANIAEELVALGLEGLPHTQ